MKQVLSCIMAILAGVAPVGAAPAPSLQTKLQTILQTYLKERARAEHVTAASVSVSNGNADAPVVAAVGAAPSNLFQIGSNTKAFTSVIVLRLEAAGKLRIDDPIGRRLPQYPAWKNLTLRRLLSMTGGIETYDNTPAFQTAYAKNPYRNFRASELVGYVYPKNGKPKVLSGWHYSNTGYILAQMIIERITGKRYGELLREEIFKPLGLRDTYYDPHVLAPAQHNRLVNGYFASNDPDNAGLRPLYDTNVKNYSLSWTQAAGGIVATPRDVSRWARALYGGKFLPAKQQAEMMTLVSTKTGRPIASATVSDPHGFGLGVAQLMKPPLGRIWYYEGETFGYRVLHAWLPQSGTIVTIGLNSQPDAKEDRIGQLMAQVLSALKR